MPEPPALYEVTIPSEDGPTTTVTDAAGVAALVRQAAATGRRVHIAPSPTTPDAASGPASKPSSRARSVGTSDLTR
ncbi:hypothetical protein E0H92_36945 [Kribbella speibonae]|uniref:Uncharacterized protein n=1 Tax=Kribbella speibonae TaxID=1572660 RepID=A0A4R0IFB2_9ACTN|nr:hypothetical protein E0H58_11515 [Kribbella speibonae]TCC30714.1 hypothetical protein E0H92_36945 [Kribbella speibonae]